MRRILLTSGGLTENFKNIFWQVINKEPSRVKIIFVPSAATESDGAREGISMSIYKFMEMGILVQNILVYNLKYLLSANYCRTYSKEVKDLPLAFRLLTTKELNEFDAIIFCGGDAGLLTSEVNRTGFHIVLNQAVENGLFYIGMSAGSMVAGGNFKEGLKYIDNHIVVHCQKGTVCGKIENNDDIFLTDEQAIWIEGDAIQLIK